MSFELAKIECDVPVDRNWDKLAKGGVDREALIALYRELEFRKLLQKLAEERDIDWH